MTETPHFALPFQWATAQTGGLCAREFEQESTEEIAACCEAIVRTVQGQRTTLPQFGRPQLEFNTAPELTRVALAQALQDNEPRVESLIEAEPSADDDLAQTVRALIAPRDEEEGSP